MAWITVTAGRPCLEEEPATWTRDMLEGARDDLFKGLIRGHKAQVKRQRTWHVSPLLQVGHVLKEEESVKHLKKRHATWTRDMLEGARDDLFKGLIRGHKAQVKRQRTWHVSPLLQVGHVLRKKSLQLGQETCLKEEEMNSSKA